MAEFINTVEIVGDDTLVDSIIQKTITEFKDQVVRTIGSYAFYSCTALENVDIPNATNIGARAFYGCTTLRKINIPSTTVIFGNCFVNCKSLTSVDFPVLATIRDFSHFNGCAMLHTVILRNVSSVVTLGQAGVFSNTPIENGLGYIYVPRALIESYKVATNWTNYASVLRVIEDYSVDGTVTGEIPVYTVYNTPNVLLTNASKGGIFGEPYQTSIEATKGYIIDNLSVTMNGVDVTSDVYDSETGVINIPSVTGDVRINVITYRESVQQTMVPLDNKSPNYLPCCKMDVFAGDTVTLTYSLTRAQGYLYDGRKCGLGYYFATNSDINIVGSMTLSIPSDGVFVVSAYHDDTAVTGELSPSANDRLYGNYITISVY